jgi:hypothetical protein
MRIYRQKKVTPSNFQSRSMCDRSQMVFPMSEMRWQYEYNATGLYNTGLLVHKSFLFEPQKNNLLAPFYGDPKPVPNARPAWYLPGQ